MNKVESRKQKVVLHAFNHPAHYMLRLAGLSLLILLSACPMVDENDPIFDTTFEVYQKGAVDARLHIAVDGYKAGWYSRVYLGDSLITDLLYSADTVITVNNLEPTTDYVFDMELYSCSELLDSQEIALTTRDTSSGVVSWESYELGVYGSWIHDVAIVDENNIWVVGDFSIPDSAGWDGPGEANYNAAHWDGNEWEFVRILSPTFCDQSYMDAYELRAIAIFSANDIWFTSGSRVAHWNGSEQQFIECISSYVSGIWGTSSSDMYFAGNGGSIVHYDGSEFVRLESGIEEDFRGIVGSDDLVLAYSRTKLQRLEGYSVHELTIVENFLKTSDDNLNIKSIEMDSNGLLIITWNATYRYHPESGDIYEVQRIDHQFLQDVWFSRTASTDLEDVWLGSFTGGIVHFNGLALTLYSEFSDEQSDYGFHIYAMDATEEMIVTAGFIEKTGGVMISFGLRN